MHSDNGAPMKGETMLATMQRLGVAHSRSRPAVSNGNPYSESLFKTLKYRPQLPLKPFENRLHDRRWVTELEHWYNGEYRHSVSFQVARVLSEGAWRLLQRVGLRLPGAALKKSFKRLEPPDFISDYPK